MVQCPTFTFPNSSFSILWIQNAKQTIDFGSNRQGITLHLTRLSNNIFVETMIKISMRLQKGKKSLKDQRFYLGTFYISYIHIHIFAFYTNFF